MILALFLVISLTSCSLIFDNDGKAYTGEPDARFNGVWMQEPSGEGDGKEIADSSYRIIFSETGTLSCSINTDALIKNTESETESGDGTTVLPEIDVSGIAKLVNGLSSSSVGTMTYRVISDTEIEVTFHSPLIDFIGSIATDEDIDSTRTIKYSFDGDVLVLEGTRYVRAE